VRLIDEGWHKGTPAKEIKPGDILLWNYGYESRVISVRDVSPQFIEITEECRGNLFKRRLKKSRLVVICSRK